MRGRGILVSGTWIVDINKRVDHWPEPQTLALIDRVVTTNGGAAFNIACVVARLAPQLPVEGIGLIGNDGAGQFVIETCRRLGIGTAGIQKTAAAPTSFTDVMSERVSGRRTFFHASGANALLDESHFDLQPDTASIFFLGYLGLLPSLDRTDASGRNGASRLFQKAISSGLLTAADLVSAPNERLAEQVKPCLPHLDVLFTNEWEAARLLGQNRSPDAALSFAEATDLATAVAALGIRGRVVLHFAEGAVSVAANGKVASRGAVLVPGEEIVGTTGAGDAFAAGYLVALAEDMDESASLELAVCSAAVSLGDITCSDALRPWEDCLTHGRRLGFRPTEL